MTLVPEAIIRVARRAPGPGAAERILVIIALVLASGTLGRLASSDDPAMVLSGSPINESVWSAFYVGAVAGLAAEGRAARRMAVCALPLAALAILALVSSLWSDIPLLSLRRGAALAGTTILAIYVAVRLPLPDFMRLLGAAIGAVALLSILTLIAAPDAGLMRGEYAGAWRGVLGEKNALGQTMAFGFVTCLVLVADERGAARAAWAGLAALCIVLVVGSRSAGSLLMVGTCGAVAALLLGFRAGLRDGLAVLAVLFACAIAVAAVVLFGVGLDGVFAALDRSPDLTGRMQMWPLVADAVRERPFLGYGYDVFWAAHAGLADYIEYSQGWRPYHAHDGFLELALDDGLAGVLLFLAVFVGGLARALLAAARVRRPAGVWPVTLLATFLAANVTESSIAKYNQLNWVLFCVAFLYAVAARPEPMPRPLGAIDRRPTPWPRMSDPGAGLRA